MGDSFTDLIGVDDPLNIPEETGPDVAPVDTTGGWSDAPMGVGSTATQGADFGGPDPTQSSGVGSYLKDAAKAAAGTFGGAAGGGLMSRNPYANRGSVASPREFQENRMSAGKPVERSRPAQVASADQIELHWIQRMRLFSGIYSGGRPTV